MMLTKVHSASGAAGDCLTATWGKDVRNGQPQSIVKSQPLTTAQKNEMYCPHFVHLSSSRFLPKYSRIYTAHGLMGKHSARGSSNRYK
eukprot:2507192-Pleurochrysis_carterae.AAC.1